MSRTKKLTDSQKRKKKNGKCITLYCRKDAKLGNYCYSCVKDKYKARNPEKNAYYVLKNNAKRRGKEFTLTLDQFLQFLKDNPTYIFRKGKKRLSLHIDRKNENEGYHYNNIQCITNSDNVKKYKESQNNCPF